MPHFCIGMSGTVMADAPACCERGVIMVVQEESRNQKLETRNQKTERRNRCPAVSGLCFLVSGFTVRACERCRSHAQFLRTGPTCPLHATRFHTAVSYTHLRAHETRHDLVCRL